MHEFNCRNKRRNKKRWTKRRNKNLIEEETKEEIKEVKPNEEEKEIIEDPNKIISLEWMTKILKEQTPKKIHLIIIIGVWWMYIITLNLIILMTY